MNIFTNDDYRRIQAWLKANAIKDSDFSISEDTVPDEDILVITQNMSTVPVNYKIKIKDLLNSSLGKIVIDKITANVVKVNNTLTVDASKVILNNEKGTTLQNVFDHFEDSKLNRHTDDTFDGNLTIKKDLTIEGHIKSDDGLTTVEENFEATGEITDGDGNMLSDVNAASKGWKIEYQNPQQDEPTVRAKYVLKDYKGVPKGNVIKVYKDSAITNVYLGTTDDTCNPGTGEVAKHEIHDNNEALSIVYRLDTGKYMLVNVPLGVFTREAEFDKYRGLGIEPNGQVFVKLASDAESANYLHFNSLGEIAADGIEARILRDLGTLISSVAGDGTMWGQYKQEEGTQETSTPNDGSRWGEYKEAEAHRDALSNSNNIVYNEDWDDSEGPKWEDPVATESNIAYNWKTTDTPASDGKTEGNLKDLYQKTLDTQETLEEIEKKIGEKHLSKQYTSTDVFNMLWGGTTDGWLNASGQAYNSYFIKILPQQTVSWQVNVGTVSSIKIFDYIPKVGDKKDSIKNLSVSPYTNDSDTIEYLYFGWLGTDERKITIIKSGFGINKEIEDLDNRIQQVSDNVNIVNSKTETNKVSIEVLNTKIGTESYSKTYTNTDFSNIIWDTDKWSASSSSYNSVIIPLYPNQTIRWNEGQYYNVKIFDYLPKLGDTRNFVCSIDNGVQSYTNETNAALFLYILRNPSQELNMLVTLSAYGFAEDIASIKNRLDSTDANLEEESKRAIAEESKINDSISSIKDVIGAESLDKDFTEQDYSNLLWSGTTDGWINASGQNYNSFIIPLNSSCTLHISDIVGTINYKNVFDYEPIEGKKDDRIDTFTIDTYTNNTDKLVYVYIGWMNGQHSLHANIDGSGILKRLQYLEKPSSELSEKTIVCFGDSITEFTERDGKKFSYPDYIRELTNANVINLGIGGTQLRQRAEPVATPTSATEGYASLDIVNLVNACCTGDFSKQVAGANYLKQYAQDDNTAIVSRASSVDWSKVDIVTILAGTNDWTSAPYPQGYGESGSKDKNLTLGAVNVIVETLLTAYPHLKIFYFTPVIRYINQSEKVGWSDDVLFFNKTLRDLSEMLLKEFRLNHIPSCNLYDDIGWNKYNFENYFIRSVDDTHPYKGFYNIARKVVAFLQANRNF